VVFKKINNELILLVGIACMIGMLAQVILVPQIYNIYNLMFEILSSFCSLEIKYANQKQVDCLSLLDTMDLNFNLVQTKCSTVIKSIQLSDGNSNPFTKNTRKKEEKSILSFTKHAQSIMIFKVLIFLILIATISVINLLFLNFFNKKANSSLQIFHTMNVRRPVLTTSMYSIFEQSATNEDIIINNNEFMAEKYIQYAYNNEEQYISLKSDIKKYYPSFYKIIETLDFNNSCSLLPSVFSECSEMYDSFMKFGLMRDYSFLIGLTQIKLREYNNLKKENKGTYEIMQNSDWLKGSEIKVCYLNSLLQSSLLNFTDNFQSYLVKFMGVQQIMLAFSLISAVFIFVIYLQMLLRKLEQVLVGIKRLLGLFPVRVLIEKEDLLSSLITKLMK
jgi:hypothetical protein